MPTGINSGWLVQRIRQEALGSEMKVWNQGQDGLKL